MSNDDRSSEVVAASIVLLVLPTVAVIFRIVSRWIAKAGFWVSASCNAIYGSDGSWE